MNLSLVLSSSPTASHAPAPANMGETTPEMAAFQDFLAVVGLPPMAVDGLDGAEGEALPQDGLSEGDAMLPEMTGNFLPPALPVLPLSLPDSAAGSAKAAEAAQTAGAPAQIAPTALPSSGEAPARQPAALSATTAAMPLGIGQMPALPDPAASAASPGATAEPRRAGLQVDLVALPQASAAAPQAQLPAVQPLPQQLPQPVLAQLLQAQTRSGDGRGDGRASGDDASLRPSLAATAIEANMVPEAETLRPVAGPAAALPAQGSAAQPLVAQPAPASSASPSAEATQPRHDFSAVVERLAEARELARPGSAEMHMPHREFGQVSVRFDLAGDALKVAMSSPDAAFAPAVQAALAERPIAAQADAPRADAPRADAALLADGQRGDAQQRGNAARTTADQIQRQREGEEGATRQSSTGSDGGLFA